MKKCFVLFCFALVALARPVSADVIFTLSPENQTIVQGFNGIFNLFVSSNSNDLVETFDFNAIAGAGNGTGGVFTAAPTFFAGGPGLPGDVTSTPGQAFSSNFTTNPFTLTSTPTLLSTLTLSTVGVAPGTYLMKLDSLNAGNPTLGPLPFTQNQISYNVVSNAIPEPTSLVSVAMIGLSVLGFGRRRRCEPSHR